MSWDGWCASCNIPEMLVKSCGAPPRGQPNDIQNNQKHLGPSRPTVELRVFLGSSNILQFSIWLVSVRPRATQAVVVHPLPVGSHRIASQHGEESFRKASKLEETWRNLEQHVQPPKNPEGWPLAVPQYDHQGLSRSVIVRSPHPSAQEQRAAPHRCFCPPRVCPRLREWTFRWFLGWTTSSSLRFAEQNSMLCTHK